MPARLFLSSGDLVADRRVAFFRKPAFFKRAIDLGCGTGLAAAAFVKEVDHFIGIDLSPRMIERARATGLYAKLEVADMVQGLRDRPDASADLVLAADAMVYLPDLAPVLGEVKRVLVTGGLLAFTVETHDGDGIVLGEGLRYTHSAGNVRGSIGEAGLMLSRCDDRSAPNEDNVPVLGRVGEAYFQMLNEKGGINGRKIKFFTMDDAYSAPKCVEATRRLVEQEEVLALFGSLGTAPQTAVHKYLNSKGVPQLLLNTGASKWNDPKNHK